MDAGQVGAEGAHGPRTTYGGSIDDRGNSCPRRGLSCAVPDDELEDRQSGVPIIGLDRLERDPESLRARESNADLYPHIVIDDFLMPAATERAVRGFSVLNSPQWDIFCVRASGRQRNGGG